MLWYKTDDEPRELVSYWTLRKAVGVLGAALPLLLVVLLLRDSALVASQACLLGGGLRVGRVRCVLVDQRPNDTSRRE